MKTVRVLNVTITVATTQAIQAWLVKQLEAAQLDRPKLVFTPNPEMLVRAQHDSSFQTLLNTADIALPDGQGLVWCSKGKIVERVTGTDTMLFLLDYANQHSLTVGFVIKAGGLSSQTQLQAVLAEQYPNISAIITTNLFTQTNLDIIFVALGVPEQEMWSRANKANCTGTKLILTVGGGVDFLTGQQKRSPLLFRKFGVEWLWRLVRQPSRLKRIFTAIIIFPYYVWKYRNQN